MYIFGNPNSKPPQRIERWDLIPKVDKVFSEFDIPDVMKTDNGPPFSSSAFESFAQTVGFKHRKITPRWPGANGEVERYVRTVKKVIKTANVEHKSWKQEMYRFVTATFHTTTRVPPGTAIFGRAMKIKLPELNEGKNHHWRKMTRWRRPR